MPTPRNGDSAQAAIAFEDGALQVSKPRPVKTEPPTEAVATGFDAPPVAARGVTELAWAAPGRTREDGEARRSARGALRCSGCGATTIAWCLPRIGPAGQLCSFDGAPR